MGLMYVVQLIEILHFQDLVKKGLGVILYRVPS